MSAVIGKSVRRPDVQGKVTGSARYAGDLNLAGMLHAKIKRSTVAHADIRRIDFSKARKETSKSASCSKSAIICWRQRSSVKSRSGCKIQLRNFLAPIGVTVRSSAASKLASRTPRESTSSRFVCVAASKIT